MGVVRKSITFTEQQDDWIKRQIEKGDFTNDSEYIRHLVRTHQTTQKDLIELEMALEEGLSSGESDKSVEEIWQEAELRYTKKNV
ncbi:MAG: type II toxin-antitoxin system ParD family antitoxin [Pricia sp.]